MPILRSNPKANFLALSNSLAQDRSLSYEARGLLIELLSRPEDWVIYKKQLKMDGFGEHKVNKVFKELRKAGYFFIIDIRDAERGCVAQRLWFVCDRPYSEEEILRFQQDLLKVRFSQREYSSMGVNPLLQIHSNTKTEYTNVNAELRSEGTPLTTELTNHPVYQLYRKYYRIYTGSEHPKLNHDALQRAVQIVGKRNGEDWHTLMASHFERSEDFETDWNFCHFATDGILDILLARQQ